MNGDRQHAAEGETENVWSVETQRSNKARERLDAVVEAVRGRQVVGPPATRRVPRDHPEVARERLELVLPVTAVRHGTVDEHKWPALPRLAVADPQTVDLDQVHVAFLPPG